jgi:hypothetical protein
MENLMQTAPTNSGEQTTPAPTDVKPIEGQAPPAAPEAKPEAEAPAKPADVVPEKYEFKAPEGETLDPAFVSTYEVVAKDLGLSQEKAQALIDKLGPTLHKNQMTKLENLQKEWAEESRSDAEFGGDKLEENLGIAKTALDKFGTPELKELINATGIGNHKELIRFFHRVGKAISEDTFVGGRREGQAGPKSFNEMADRLYGKK